MEGDHWPGAASPASSRRPPASTTRLLELCGLDAILPFPRYASALAGDGPPSSLPLSLAGPLKLDAIVEQLKPCRAMPQHAMPQDHPHLTEHTLRPAVTDRDGGILACMHTHLPGNYSWTREPVGFCRLRVEPSCHVRGSCPMSPTRILLLPWPATSKPCVCSRLTSRTAGGRMPRIDETVYTVLSTACRFGMSRGAELLRREALSVAAAATHTHPLGRPVREGTRLSVLTFCPPAFMTAMTRMSVGTCMCCCGTQCHIPNRWTSACMHQIHYCCMAADYCTEARQDLPRGQSPGVPTTCWKPHAHENATITTCLDMYRCTLPAWLPVQGLADSGLPRLGGGGCWGRGP